MTTQSFGNRANSPLTRWWRAFWLPASRRHAIGHHTMQAMKLADVRKLMTARGIASAGSLEAARKIVGSANSREPFLRNMSVALSLMTWRNTAEDWQRLEATLMVRAVKRKASTIATAN